MGLYVGLDIGGTKFIAAACRRDGAIMRRTRKNAPAGLDEGLALLNRMAGEVAAGESIIAMGAAIVSGNGIRRIYGKPAEELNDREWEEVGYNLGQGLRNMAAILLPDIIVLGGGVAVGGGERLLVAARGVIGNCLKIMPVPEVRISALGNDTALMGALSVAMDGL